MLLNILFSCASKYILISDESKNSANNLVTFQDNNDRLLYEILYCYVQHYRDEKEFYDLLKVLHTYFECVQVTHCRKPSPTEIILLLATHVINKFGLGKFNSEILNIEKQFSDEIYENINALCKYKYQTVVDSLNKQFIEYDYQDYEINKSSCYLCKVLSVIFYKIIKCQMDLQRWQKQRNDRFEKTLLALVPDIDLSLYYVFSEARCQFTCVNLTLLDILSGQFTRKNALDYLYKLNAKNIYILASYSFLDMVEAVDKFNKNFSLFKIQDPPYTQTFWYLKRYENFWSTRRLIRKINIVNYNFYITYMLCGVDEHAVFFSDNIDVGDADMLDNWKENAHKLARKADDAYRFFKTWYDSKE